MTAIFRAGFLVAFGLITASFAVCAQAPTITRDLPSGITVLVGCRATFVIEVEGAEPLTYRWYRDGEVIPDAISSMFTIQQTTLGDNGAMFYAIVSNTSGSVQSHSCSLSIAADVVPPIVTGVRTGTNLEEVVVSFSTGGCEGGGMDAATVSEPFNYSFGDDLEILSARFIPPTTAALTTSTQVFGHIYTLTINYVRDVSGNVMRPTSVSFTAMAGVGIRSPLLTGQKQLQFEVLTTFPNVDTLIEASPDLLEWAPIRTNRPTTNTFLFVDDSPATNRHRFYRVVLPSQQP